MSERAESQQPATPASTDRTLWRTMIAIGLAWLVPGLGHMMVGRRGRALLFGLLVWGSVGLGLAHDGRLALRDQRQPLLTSLQIVANLGIGPFDMLARRWVYGEVAYSMSARRPDERSRVEIFRDRARSPVSIYGTAYLWTAGLMNLLLLFDVWDIGRGRKP